MALRQQEAALKDFSDGSDADIKASLAAELAQQHLAPVSIDVLRAAQPAPVVVAMTSNPRRAARDANTTIGALFGVNPAKYEGYYLEIRDTNSKPVLIESAAFRSG
jgi:hypothetical protein